MRLYQNCDELPKWNFDQIIKTSDLRYLIHGYEYGEANTPKEADVVWDAILEEYHEKTSNNKTLQYFELLDDVDTLENRRYFGTVIIEQLVNRWFQMPKDIKKEYLQQLREFGFYIDERKSFSKEVQKIEKQLRVIDMKIETKRKAIIDFEEKNYTNEGITTLELKVKIQKICKVQLDLKKVAVSEWLLWIDEAMNTKEAA